MGQIFAAIALIIVVFLVLWIVYFRYKKNQQRNALIDLFKQYISPNISEDDEKKIAKSIEELKETAKIAEGDVQDIKSSVISDVITRIGKDLVFTDEEAKYLESCLKKLGVKISDKDALSLNEWKEHANILKGEIPSIQINYNLSKGEVAYYIGEAKLNELKHYSGRGKYAVPHDQLIEKDSGEIILSNNRILFVGSKKNISLKFDKILMLKPYKDCIELHKGSGNPYYFMFQEPVKFFFMYTYLSKKDSGNK